MFSKALFYIARIIEKRHEPLLFEGWHSWDSAPWEHPWLTYNNLRDMKEFSALTLENLQKKIPSSKKKCFKFGFIGNIANNLYTHRMIPLRHSKHDLKLFRHPHDQYLMSQPEWEEFDGILKCEETNFLRLQALGYKFPKISMVHEEKLQFPSNRLSSLLHFLLLNLKNAREFLISSHFFPLPKSHHSIQKMDALWCSQFPYIGYFSGCPYVVSQTGGDIWFECARGDLLGLLQRRAFQNANMFLVSNPWSYAHARRYGFNHLLQLPMMLDETIYTPGHGKFRKEWEESSKGNFFVFSSSRFDEGFKGNHVALCGFAEFCKKVPGARLVLVKWGLDQEKAELLLDTLGIKQKVIWLPLSGKKRLRDYYRSVDCFFDQFVLGYYGAAGLEAMALGLPIISNLKREQYEATCATGAPPVLQANTPQEVTAHLEALYKDQEFKRTLGKKTRQWFLDNHGTAKWKDAHLTVLTATALGIKPDFSNSPLNAPLSAEEKAYHSAQMAKAPIFPNYVLEKKNVS